MPHPLLAPSSFGFFSQYLRQFDEALYKLFSPLQSRCSGEVCYNKSFSSLSGNEGRVLYEFNDPRDELLSKITTQRKIKQNNINKLANYLYTGIDADVKYSILNSSLDVHKEIFLHQPRY